MSTYKSEEDKSYERIPVWDGTAVGMIQFEKDIKWWLAEISDIENIRYNIAARLVNKQKGAVKERAQLRIQNSYGINQAIGLLRKKMLRTFALTFGMESTG